MDLKQLVASTFGIDVSDVKDNSHILNELASDSLDTVELIIAIESEYGITIPDEDVENFATVSDIQNFIDEQG